MSTSEKIVAIARKYVGQHEKPGNMGFKDPSFEAKMKAVGWKQSQAWCAAFAELVWKEAFSPEHEMWPVLDQLFSVSAVATFSNFKNSKHFTTGSLPKPGAVAIWKQGNTWQGHAGIVSRVVGNAFQCIEGNTNSAGGREGIEVAEKMRAIGAPFNPRGLNLVGFIYPMD